MRRNGFCIVFFSIVLLTSNACLAGTNLTESCEPDQELGGSPISENTPEIAGEEGSVDDILKKELLPLDDIVSSIFQVPGDIIDGIANIPLDDIVLSTLQVPGDVVKFVAEIPYDEIVWSTLEASAKVIEFIVDDGFFLGFFMGYYCHN